MTAHGTMGQWWLDTETDRANAHAAACRKDFEGQDIPETAPPEPQFPRPHLSAMNTDKPVLRLSYVVWGITAALWAYPAALLVGWVLQYFGSVW